MSNGTTHNSEDDCCAHTVASSNPENTCPESATRGQPVQWLTIEALATVELPTPQPAWLCRDPNCAVVYFGPHGLLLTRTHLSVDPKTSDPNKTYVCYCFQHTLAKLQQEVLNGVDPGIFESVTAQVKAGNCRCETRNPSGRCCLGEIKKTRRKLALGADDS